METRANWGLLGGLTVRSIEMLQIIPPKLGFTLRFTIILGWFAMMSWAVRSWVGIPVLVEADSNWFPPQASLVSSRHIFWLYFRDPHQFIYIYIYLFTIYKIVHVLLVWVKIFGIPSWNQRSGTYFGKPSQNLEMVENSKLYQWTGLNRMNFLRHSLPWPLHSGCGCDAPVDVNPLWAAGRLFPSWMDWPVVCGTPEVGGQGGAERDCYSRIDHGRNVLFGSKDGLEDGKKAVSSSSELGKR